MSEEQDYYKILQVSKDANIAELKAAFRRLALQYHPDVIQKISKQKKNFSKFVKLMKFFLTQLSVVQMTKI